MYETVKPLIVILVLAVPAFYLGRQLAASVIAPREFAVWRNAWLATTVAAFLSGNFFLFAAIMVIICFYAHTQRVATAALFIVLLLAVPLIATPISGFAIINQLFEIDNGRLLTIVLLLPIVFAAGRWGRGNSNTYTLPDRLIVAYVLIRIGVATQKLEVTQVLRYGTVLTLDALIPYLAFSRTVTSVADLRRVLLAFIIAVLPLSLIAVFETAKGWLLYGPILQDWGVGLMPRYLLRGDMLRALASTAQSLVLGFVIMAAIGCTLALRQSIGSRRYSGIALAILGAGLVASLARGAWVGAAVLVLVYLATSPNAVVKLTRFAVIGAMVTLPLLLTPVGERLFDALPFIGTIDADNVTYRQRLYDNTIPLIESNPWLGTPSDTRLMPDIRAALHTHERMVDIVNTYLEIALDSGLVSLGFFFCFFTAILIGLWRVRKFAIFQEMGFGDCVRGSIATLVAIIVTIATVSFIDYIPYICWSFAGICVALIRIAYQERAAVARAADAIPAIDRRRIQNRAIFSP
jgi:O-antigen ligase